MVKLFSQEVVDFVNKDYPFFVMMILCGFILKLFKFVDEFLNGAETNSDADHSGKSVLDTVMSFRGYQSMTINMIVICLISIIFIKWW